MTDERRPSRDEVARAAGRTIPDVLAPGLRVLFCGINPSLYSGAVGHHFARPGNRFWKARHLSGFTDRVLSPFEDAELAQDGLGLTNLVGRSTVSAAELSAEELREGAVRLERNVRQIDPRVVAVLGIGAYRKAFARPKAELGRQPEVLAAARLWVLPNPSGVNAHYQIDALADAFAELRSATEPER